MSEEARVLRILGLPHHAIPDVLADPECRVILDRMMGTLRATARELNAVIGNYKPPNPTTNPSNPITIKHVTQTINTAKSDTPRP